VKNDYPRPAIWPPSPTPPRRCPPVPPPLTPVPLWQKAFGAASLCCSTLGMAGVFLINPVYETTGHIDPAAWEYHQFLATLWGTAALLVLAGWLAGVLGWRSLSGKIGVVLFLLTVLGWAIKWLLSYWRISGHF